MVVVGNGVGYRKSGSSWQPISVSGNMNDVVMTGTNSYYAVGDGGRIVSSVSGQNILPSTTTKLNAVYFLTSTTGFIAGDNGLLLKTTDGRNWKELTTPIKTNNWVSYLYPTTTGKASNLQSIYAQDKTTVYAVGDGGLLLKSIDGGVTWSARESQSDSKLTDIQAKKDGSLVLSGEQTALLRYTDQTDEYSARFYYDGLGRLVASQNSKQHSMTPQRYSYTVYDGIGRVVEAGEIEAGIEPSQAVMDSEDFPTNWGENRYQLTRTIYDKAISSDIENLFAGKQQNLRNRVASVIYQDNYDADNKHYKHAVHYSYDIHGNVKELVEDNPALALTQGVSHRYKKLTYDYDLVSGNVNKVSYQDKQPDQYYHRYDYDADNRIVSVETSADGSTWSKEAGYQYYKHGPLARTELGNKIQGIDYAYTLQGWIKAVNNPGSPSPTLSGEGAGEFAPDAFGYSLHYNREDYMPINTAVDFLTSVSSGEFADAGNRDEPGAGSDLYNGNIAKMATAISGMPLLGKTYQYDELNRLVKSNTYEGANLTAATNSAYNTSYKYDANGNILSLNRNGNNGTMDALTYHYAQDANGKILTNRLLHVNDGQTNIDLYGTDIDDQGNFVQNNPTMQNYAYDKTGNLISDKQEEIAEIKWNVQGKVTDIIRTAGSTKSNLHFAYDALGNRISKTVVYPTAIDGVKEVTTYYIKDASGNVMATYDKKVYDNGNEELYLTEQHIYGSSRLGMRQMNVLLASTQGGAVSNPNFANVSKNYELTNHLGNVLAVVSDTKKDDGRANVVSASDYFPFGMQVPGRVNESEGYRYGFTGHEKINEVSGTGNTVDMGDRWLDVRLGRTAKMDAYATKYPTLSPYSYAGNNPILFVDPDGKQIIAAKGSEEKVLYAITSSFADPKIRGLFEMDANGVMMKISKNDFNEALKGVDSKDVYHLAYAYFLAINDSEIKIPVEVDNTRASAYLSDKKRVTLNENETVQYVTGKDESGQEIIEEKSSSIAETMAHEVLGHAFLTLNGDEGNLFMGAIQMVI